MSEIKLLNFRDIALSTSPSNKHLKSGMVFRSASLDSLCDQEVETIIKSYNIHTIIDLRSRSKKDDSHLPICKMFPETPLNQITLPKQSFKEKFNHHESSTITKRQSYRIDFVGKGFQRSCVWKACSFRLKLKLIALLAIQQHDKAAVWVGRKVMTPMGVATMYQHFVSNCQVEIISALRIFVDSSQYPIIVHCTHGKDRTAIVIALILSILDVSRDSIIEDYVQTQTELAHIRADILEDMEEAGLSEEFADADPKNMNMLLSFLESNYGSIKQYLKSIGFSETEQDAVRENLILLA
ncbi:protein-tyrosine phosphatase-like protein [Phycomyces blakesleeanus]|uniref:Protein-tyrosine phosphatase-like protein n=2 Tax=Phycomyces blakesleeanus TaxID=4837 RepID=A0ABR3APG2_PHYBL